MTSMGDFDRRRGRSAIPRTAKTGGFLQPIVEQKIAIVALQESGGDPRAILEPGQQVGRRGGLVEEVMLHHARPDEVVGAHRREQSLQLQAVDIAGFLEMIVERVEMAFVDERRPVAHVGEIDQAADQGRRMRVLAAALRRQPRQRDRHQRPAEAEGEQVGRGLGPAAHFVDRRDDAVDDIILDALVLMLGPGIDPLTRRTPCGLRRPAI